MTPLNAPIDIGGIWRIGIFFGLASIVVGLIWRHLRNVEGLLLTYVLISALYILEYPALPFGDLNTAFQATAGQVLAEVVLITMGAIVFQRQAFKILPYFVAFETLCIWANRDGLLTAYTFATAFLAATLPFLPLWLSAAVIITVLFHHGSTALMVLGAQLFALVLVKRRFRPWAPLLFGVLAYSAYLHHGLAGYARITKYQQFMTFWASQWKWIWLGVGPGSFMWTSLILEKFKGDIYLQMHSDWLQITFELGLIGLVLTLAVWVKNIYHSWDNPRILAALFGCGAFGLTYYPLRFFPTAFFVAMVIARANKNRRYVKPSRVAAVGDHAAKRDDQVKVFGVTALT